MEEPIIPPIPVEAIEAELTPDRFLRNTNKGGNRVYVLDGREAVNTMHEIGRLREIAFRGSGGGTGKACDIDEFDLMDPPCRQLIVWDPDNKIILGGYRFIIGDQVVNDSNGRPRIATSHLFNFSDTFKEKYLPGTLELGRSFVRVGYQSSKAASKTIYALDNLWDGLGALTVVYPRIKYLFGKVTMYPSYGEECRNMILWFLNKHFPDREQLVTPIIPLETHTDAEAMKAIFTGKNFDEDYKILNRKIREAGKNIPPLVNAYMALSPSMRMFGTAINDEFGNVEETGIFFAVDEIYEHKKARHIGTFTNPR